jgi:hypothetical protein
MSRSNSRNTSHHEGSAMTRKTIKTSNGDMPQI